PIVRWAIAGWVWLYTLPLPGPVKDRRREELAYDVVAQIVDAREERRLDLETAILLTGRFMLGIPGDVLWAAGSLPMPVLFLHGAAIQLWAAVLVGSFGAMLALVPGWVLLEMSGVPDSVFPGFLHADNGRSYAL